MCVWEASDLSIDGFSVETYIQIYFVNAQKIGIVDRSLMPMTQMMNQMLKTDDLKVKSNAQTVQL